MNTKYIIIRLVIFVQFAQSEVHCIQNDSYSAKISKEKIVSEIMQE